MEKYVKSFISDTLPEFISSDNSTFKLFIEAYYEYLEKRNDSESLNVKEMFKAIDNPMAVVNNSSEYKDIDNTLDSFLDYFKREFLPIAVETSSITDRVLIKKIRDVYLAKGSPKSFELLFRMLYNEEIDIYETRDNIIEASEGKYLSFPIATFKVVNYSNNISVLNFSLANLSHSDDNFVTDSDVAIILNSTILGKTGDSDKAFVINVQLNFAFAPDPTQIYRITDQNDDRIFIEVQPFLSLSGLTATNNAPGYIEGDIIQVKSKSLNRTFNVIVDSVNNGPVTGLHFRDRGEFFKQGDSFVFTPNVPGQGTGGSATVTRVDKNGRILQVDGYDVRTGKLNNGFLSDDFENVIVPVISGGSYTVLPDVSVNSVNTIQQGLPYAKEQTNSQGAIFSPISTRIGTIADISIFDRGYFADANDVLIQAPMNVTVEGRCEFLKGQLVVFQYLDQKNESFFNDSDRLDISIKAYKTVDGGAKYNIKNIRLPYGFDSELFQWQDSDFVIDSDTGLTTATTLWKQLVDSEDNFDYEIMKDSDQGFNVRLYNRFLNQLDSYHFNKLNNYTFDDSDYKFSWYNDYTDPKLGVDSEIAEWKNTSYYGIVNRISPTKKVISLLPATNRQFATDSDLESIDIVKNRLLRVAAFNVASDNIIIREKKPLVNFVAFHSRAKYIPVLTTSGTTNKTFINEDGFLNSLSGGVIQDNYFYSFYTYIIQSNLSIDLWRNKIKETLHPAGLLMFGETNLNQNGKVPLNIKSKSSTEIINTKYTFDTMLDHYTDPKNPNRVSADNTIYESNAFLFYDQTNPNLYAITASSFERGYDEALVSEQGASWFDFEPMGLVRREKVNHDNFYNNYLNFDSDTFYRNITTQDSDGSGYVKVLLTNYKKYDGTIQDLYKKESRTRASYDPVHVASTKFIDPINDLYTVYDSDLPVGFHLRWTDNEDRTYSAIDYNRLKSKHDTRTFKWFNTDRKKEMMFKKATDFNKAMRLNGSLIFTEQDGTVLTDFDAFERKWNEINSFRQDSEGWEINGYSSFIQNIKAKPRFLYTTYAEKRTPDYRKFKTPFKEIVWDNLDSDNIVWNAHYVTGDDSLLNSSEGILFDWYDVNQKPNLEEWRDPLSSMKGRKVK